MSLIEAAHAVTALFGDSPLPTQLLVLSSLTTGQARICPFCQWFTPCGQDCLCEDAA